MKVVIVGGVAGGATAAARLRRLDEAAEIVVFERSGYISYANCGLPYYIGGVIQDQEELTLQTPQGFWDRFRIDVRVRHEATAIHREEKTVTVKNLETGEVTTEYISEKETMVVRLNERGGTKEIPVPEDQREAPVLTDDERNQLVTLANRIEAFYKKPEDIEWAIVDGQVYLLQSRPITTMK